MDPGLIAKRDIDELVKRQPVAGSPVLSVYLDVDPSRSVNRNHGFETALRNMLRAIDRELDDDPARREFAGDAARVQGFVSGHTPGAQSLVLFCDDSQGFFWWREVAAALQSDARWSDTPYVRPLLEALDEFERYGVVLADRAHARLFTVFMGRIEEHREVFAAADVRHFKAPGRDRLRSHAHLRRKADAHALWYLKEAARQVDHLADRHSFDRLILAGAVEATHDLGRLLPRRLRSRLVATIALPVEASERQVLDATLGIVREVERSEELRLVDDLITAATKSEAAVTGAEATLARVQGGRAVRLVYAEGLALAGWRCAGCAALFADRPASCPDCGGDPRSLDDLLEPMIEGAIESGGRVEEVRGDAAARLRQAGGIGAFLRF